METLLFLVGAVAFLFLVSWIRDMLVGDRMAFTGSYDWMLTAAIVIILVVFAVWKYLEFRGQNG